MKRKRKIRKANEPYLLWTVVMLKTEPSPAQLFNVHLFCILNVHKGTAYNRIISRPKKILLYVCPTLIILQCSFLFLSRNCDCYNVRLLVSSIAHVLASTSNRNFVSYKHLTTSNLFLLTFVFWKK